MNIFAKAECKDNKIQLKYARKKFPKHDLFHTHFVSVSNVIC
jgi:hypothetical protein